MVLHLKMRESRSLPGLPEGEGMEHQDIPSNDISREPSRFQRGGFLRSGRLATAMRLCVYTDRARHDRGRMRHERLEDTHRVQMALGRLVFW
jgi:hypothetical protein